MRRRCKVNGIRAILTFNINIKKLNIGERKERDFYRKNVFLIKFFKEFTIECKKARHLVFARIILSFVFYRLLIRKHTTRKAWALLIISYSIVKKRRSRRKRIVAFCKAEQNLWLLDAIACAYVCFVDVIDAKKKIYIYIYIYIYNFFHAHPQSLFGPREMNAPDYFSRPRKCEGVSLDRIRYWLLRKYTIDTARGISSI